MDRSPWPVSRWIEDRTGRSIRKSSAPPAATAPSRSRPGAHTITAADPLPDDLRHLLDCIRTRAHVR